MLLQLFNHGLKNKRTLRHCFILYQTRSKYFQMHFVPFSFYVFFCCINLQHCLQLMRISSQKCEGKLIRYPCTVYIEGQSKRSVAFP